MDVIQTNNLPLENGMVFTDYKIIAEHIGYTKSQEPCYIRRALSHYCKFHYTYPPKEIVIYIDQVLDEVKPFAGHEYKYNVGDVIENKFGAITIVQKTTLPVHDKQSGKYKNRSAYVCECNKHHNQFTILQQSIIRGNSGCPICGRKRITKDNLLADKAPEACKYLVNKNDAYNYAYRSSKKVLCECPRCHAQKEVAVINLTAHGFSCTKCGDGFSYPNKFVYSLLEQLKINHISEYYPAWIDRRFYDQYLPDQNIIIENHGMQHYETIRNFEQTVEDIQENDLLKKQVALDNGIKHYVILDCRYSDKDWIKTSIMNSILPQLLHFTENDINWDKCAQDAVSSVFYDVCMLWNQTKDIQYIHDIIKLTKTTLRTYIRDGYKCGLCDVDYIPKSKLIS